MLPKSRKFPVFSLMIREFDRGEQFASDCVIRQPVLISRYSPPESPNSARQRLISNVSGSGADHIPANGAQFAAKVSVGKFGATVWAGRRKELGRTKEFENLEQLLTNLFRPIVPVHSKAEEVGSVRSEP
jgi:hypothetical protein